MSKFDFVVGKAFKESLEADFGEVERCFQEGAWKSVQVLAGSIVEALLIDYLLATPSPSRGNRDPLRMDLAEAVAACLAEGVLSNRSADLCSVVRSYRNLIHPGRAVRLGEDPPSASSARIAVSLIDLIVEDVARARRDEYGLTADQILGKIERDPRCLAILRHLIGAANQQEQETLVLEVLPSRYVQLRSELGPFPDDFDEATLERIRRAYAIAKEVVSIDIVAKATQAYYKILREADGSLVSIYDDTFVEPEDFRHLKPEQRNMVLEHWLDKLRPVPSSGVLKRLRGIEGFLSDAHITLWLDPLVRGLTAAASSDELKEQLKSYLLEASAATTPSADEGIKARLKLWETSLEHRGQSAEAAVLHELRESWDALPF